MKLKFKPITVSSKVNRISRESIQRLDLLLLTLETIDLNGIESIYILSRKHNLNQVFPSKVTIWKLRNNNPMRKSYVSNKIELNEFEALIKLTVEMSGYLYPYIRDILQSRDNFDEKIPIWDEFKKRFIELTNERFNTNSMKVKKLLDPNLNDDVLIKLLLTLAFCNSEDGFLKLKTSLLDC